MFCVTVTYPERPAARFDVDYYVGPHVALIRARLGAHLRRVEVRRGLGGVDGAAPAYRCVANVWVDSAEAFAAAMAVHGAEILGDLPNDTDLPPTLQLDQVLASA